MPRFIRTKDGELLDLQNQPAKDCGDFILVCTHRVYKDDIAKQADTIEELIEVGDLVKENDEPIYEIMDEDYLEELKRALNYYCSVEITELYAKQGRNYVLVWTKEEGVI